MRTKSMKNKEVGQSKIFKTKSTKKNNELSLKSPKSYISKLKKLIEYSNLSYDL